MKNNLIFNPRLVVFTIIFLTILLPIFSIIHEMGHGLVCYAAGNEFVWGVSPLGLGWLVCLGPIEDQMTFRLAGGFLATITAWVILLFILPRLKRNTISFAIPLAAIAASQAVTALLEAFANDFYMNSTLPPAVTGIITAVIMVLLIFRHSQKGVVRKDA